MPEPSDFLAGTVKGPGKEPHDFLFITRDNDRTRIGEFVYYSAEIAGEDRKFVWADARIDDNAIVVSAAGVPKPVAVRYAWAENPKCNLFNGEGLPASPFRTDDWPIGTSGILVPGGKKK